MSIRFRTTSRSGNHDGGDGADVEVVMSTSTRKHPDADYATISESDYNALVAAQPLRAYWKVSAGSLVAMTASERSQADANRSASSAAALAVRVAEDTARLNPFTSSLKGLAPLSGGGTTKYLRADGTWVVPASTNANLTGDVTSSGNATTIATAAVSLAKMATVATARFLGRATASMGVVEALTGTQATTLLDAFTSSLKGLVPSSGGGTTKYLRADGTWVVPPASVAGVTYIRSQYITSGTTITSHADATTWRVKMIGGGGGGGGADNNSGSYESAAGGGGSGARSEVELSVSGSTGYTCAVGAGGTGQVGTSGAKGSDGGATSLTVGVAVTAPGGLGGLEMHSPSTGDYAVAGGAGGAAGANADLALTGVPGGHGMSVDGSVRVSGAGGAHSMFGVGGAQVVDADAYGGDASGYGAGGGGGAVRGTTGQDGGDGSGGLIIVEEYG